MATILTTYKSLVPLILLAIVGFRLAALDLRETLVLVSDRRMSVASWDAAIILQATGRAHAKHALHDYETHTELVTLVPPSSYGWLPREQARGLVAENGRAWKLQGHWYELGVRPPLFLRFLVSSYGVAGGDI